MRLAVKGWTQFQHYKHRKPPWIRLHRKLIDDIDWHRLPIASRALAPMLWLLASETMNGVIDGDSDAIAFRLRIASKDFEEALSPLIAGGWLLLIEPEKGVLAPRLQDAPSESEIRVQSTDTLTSNHTDPARGAALRRDGSAPRAKPPTTTERLAQLAEENRRKMVGNA
jgi:hypothetical protein